MAYTVMGRRVGGPRRLLLRRSADERGGLVEKGGAMTEVSDAEVGEIDLAVVAYRDEGDWSLSELPDRSLDSVETIAKELRRYPGDNGALALISVAEDFVLLVRAQ